MHINGMPVFESDMAMEITDKPVKRHDPSKGSAAYHRRIQKKWNKRYGFEKKPCIYQTRMGFYVHPALIPEIRRLMREAEV